MSSEPTCAERIDAELEKELAVLRDLFEMEDRDEYHEEHQTNIVEYGLCFDLVAMGTFDDQTRPYYRYQISWGGPSDEFRFYQDGSIEYWFMDWFDGAFRTLQGDDKTLLAEIAECEFGLGVWHTWEGAYEYE